MLLISPWALAKSRWLFTIKIFSLMQFLSQKHHNIVMSATFRTRNAEVCWSFNITVSHKSVWQSLSVCQLSLCLSALSVYRSVRGWIPQSVSRSVVRSVSRKVQPNQNWNTRLCIDDKIDCVVSYTYEKNGRERITNALSLKEGL